MSKLIAVKKRILSVKRIRKITKAMNIVAATQRRKAEKNILALREYTQRLDTVLKRIMDNSIVKDHPLVTSKYKNETNVLIIITSDKGLCGAFNSNILKTASEYLKSKNEYKWEVVTVGKKAYQFFKKRKENIIATHFLNVSYERISTDIKELIVQKYIAKKVDNVYIVYNYFKNILASKKIVLKILPIGEGLGRKSIFGDVEPVLGKTTKINEGKKQIVKDYIFDGSIKSVLDEILPEYINNTIYTALLESKASEEAARMTAMDSATNNANEMIDRLSIMFNKARQTAITTELLEVVQGAEHVI